jgi:hypothetical protein
VVAPKPGVLAEILIYDGKGGLYPDPRSATFVPTVHDVYPRGPDQTSLLGW